MKLSSIHPLPPVSDVDSAGRACLSSGKTKAPRPGITSHFSKQAISLNSLKAKLTTVPDIRQNKVVTLQKAISSCTYSVPEEKLADAIVQEEA